MKYSELLALLFLVVCFYNCETAVRNKRDISGILNKATELKSKAQNVTKALLQHNRTEDAKVIEVLATRVNDFDIKVLDARGHTELMNQMAQELTFAEAVLTLAFERVNETQFNYKELQTSLINNGTESAVKYNRLIDMLRQQNITREELIIENDLKLVNASLSTLKSATLVVEVLVAATNLTIFVTQIQSDFKGLSLVTFNITGRYRDIIVDRAVNLAHQVNDVSDKMKNQPYNDTQRTEMTAGLKAYMDEIYVILAKLKLATNSTPVNELEANLTLVESRLEEKLSALTAAYLSGDTTVALLNRIKDLSAVVLLQSQKLRALNKTAESDEFLRQNKLLVELDYSVRNPAAGALMDEIYFDYKFLVIKDSVGDLIKLYGIH